MASIIDTKAIIIELKRIRDENNYSYNDINKLIEANGDYPLSKSSLSRLFATGSEDKSFEYETTIAPVARALIGKKMDNPVDLVRIEKLVSSIENIALLEKGQIDFLKEQLAIKDRQIDNLLKSTNALIESMADKDHVLQGKDNQIMKMVDHLINKMDER